MSGANVAGSALNATRSRRSAKAGIAEDAEQVLERVEELDDRAEFGALERVAAGQALVPGEHARHLAVVPVQDLDHLRGEGAVRGALVDAP